MNTPKNQTLIMSRRLWILSSMATLSSGNISANASQKPTVNRPRLADAIFWAEGGWKTKYPYGIKINGRRFTEHKARLLCFNTIESNFKRWSGSGSFIDFLSLRYCPPSVDSVGNRNWKKNVKYFYNNPKPLRP